VAVFSGLAVLAAKIASASTVAQAAAGLGIAVAGVTGAGAAGLLPGPLQDGVAGAVEAVTPFELPHSEADAAPAHRDTSDSRLDGPGDVPTATDVPTSAPTTEQEEQEAEVEHSAEATDATHQHRGGHSETVPSPATVTGAPRTSDDHVETHSTETESHSGGDDSGGGSGSGSGSGSGGSGGDDDSGHGGDDDGR
jgi:hypothetical protein